MIVLSARALNAADRLWSCSVVGGLSRRGGIRTDRSNLAWFAASSSACWWSRASTKA
jgi:hypothetical protein